MWLTDIVFYSTYSFNLITYIEVNELGLLYRIFMNT